MYYYNKNFFQKNSCRFVESRCGSTDSEQTSNRMDSSEAQNWDTDEMETRGWPRQNSVSFIIILCIIYKCQKLSISLQVIKLYFYLIKKVV